MTTTPQTAVEAAHALWYAKLNNWKDVCQRMKDDKATEDRLRRELFEEAFPTPTEGTQRVVLTDGTILKGEFKLTRKLDVAIFNSLQLPQRLKDMVVKNKIELDLTQYRTLSKEDLEIFDECLVITPAKPALSIEIAPKKS